MNEVRTTSGPGQSRPGTGTPTIQPPPKFGGPQPPAAKPKEDDSPIGLIGDGEGEGDSKIKSFGSAAAGAIRKEEYSRELNKTGHGSCRLRSFHGRLSAQGLEYLDNQINEWLEHHPEVEVKFVTSTVGVFEGKMREPALILNVWF